MRIGLVQEKQNELYQFQKEEICYSLEEAKRYQQEMILQNKERIEEAIEARCDLIVTSEAINFPGQPRKIIGDYMELIPETESYCFDEFSKLAKKGNCYIAVGVYRKEVSANKRNVYNSILFYNRQGELYKKYNKVHLAGEEKDYLTKGNCYCVAETDFGRIGMAVCWDMQFPETCQTLADLGADMVIAPTWGWEWRYGSCRAYENGIYVASAMAVPFSGTIEGMRSPSEVITPEGISLVKGSLKEAQIVFCDIPDIRDCISYREFRRSERRQILATELLE